MSLKGQFLSYSQQFFTQEFPSLKSLDISGAKVISDLEVGGICRFAPRLENLVLTNADITEIALLLISCKLRCLKKLRINKCNNVKSERLFDWYTLNELQEHVSNKILPLLQNATRETEEGLEDL